MIVVHTHHTTNKITKSLQNSYFLQVKFRFILSPRNNFKNLNDRNKSIQQML